MSSKRPKSRSTSRMIAFSGMMAGLSVALMLTGGLVPVATYCAPMAASVLLLPILFEYGRKAGIAAFLSVSLLSFMLSADKEAAFFYTAVGWYPLVKWSLDRIRGLPLRLVLKLLLFTLSVGGMYFVLCVLFPVASILQEFGEMGPALLAGFFVVLDICLLLYDRLLYPLSFLYWNRVRPRLSAFFD